MSHAIAPLAVVAPATRTHSGAAAGAGTGDDVFPALMAAAAGVKKTAAPGTTVEPADPRLEPADAALLLDGVLTQLGIAPAAAPAAGGLPGLAGDTDHAATALTAGLDGRPAAPSALPSLPTDPLAQAIAQAHATGGADPLTALVASDTATAAGAAGQPLPAHAPVHAPTAEPHPFAGGLAQNLPAATPAANSVAAPSTTPGAALAAAPPATGTALPEAEAAPAPMTAAAGSEARHAATALPPQPAPAPATASAAVAAATVALAAPREASEGGALDGLAPSAPDALQAAFAASDTRLAAAPARVSPLLPPVTMPADPDAGFDHALASRIGWMADQGIGHARIRITPDHLGTIDLQLRVDGDKVSAEFQSAHADVRHALESGLNRLRDQLAEQGLQLSRAQVGDGGKGGDGESRDGAHTAGRMAPISGPGDDAGAETIGLPDAATARRGLVDEYV